jgi:C1A family cysteine protease
MSKKKLGRMGWLRDLPDFRDLHVGTAKVAEVLTQSKALKRIATKLGTPVDLRRWCSPVEDQGDIGSCTANAGVALLEYFQRRATGKHLDASRLFLYKTTRNLLGWTGDDGAFLRTTMKAMVLFGIPPEEYWQYEKARLNEEPPAFCYAFAQNYRSIIYYRLDPPGTPPDDILANVRKCLSSGLPAMFGFTVYSSMPGVGDKAADIPFPGDKDSCEGGHAVVAVGYDDSRRIGKCTGALLIRNSWGSEWGDHGYGWLPYDYVTRGLADDFWTLLRAEYKDLAKFEE